MDFILEIGTEEMPSMSLYDGIVELKKNAEILLNKNRINYSLGLETYGTPRRLVLEITGLDEKQQDFEDSVKGPPKKVAIDDDGNLSKASTGFAKSQGVEVSDLFEKDNYIYALKKLIGKPTKEVLGDISVEIINSLQFPKTMRWGSGSYEFIRPIRWIMAIFGDQLIDVSIGDVKSEKVTFGHRFLSPGKKEVSSVSDYHKLMDESFVVVDAAERKKIIIAEIDKSTSSVKGKAIINDKVLLEVVNLVESPSALLGSFSKEYLRIPREVVETAMQSHQRYFPVEKDGQLLPHFVVIQNGAKSYAKEITKGHERVLSARLADAAFFFDEDIKTPLAEKADKLQGIVYQQDLGTVLEKIERVKELCHWFAGELDLSKDEKRDLIRAATLSKADLVTGMVREFPELQGSIGSEYALVDGENKQVAKAIADHYLPRFAGDELPDDIVSAILAIADKAITITGCFSVGLLPSGSQDPYALRRQAQGIVAIMAASRLNLSITDLMERSLDIYQLAGIDISGDDREKLVEFWTVRMSKYYAAQGYATAEVGAVLAAGFMKLEKIRERLDTLKENRSLDRFERVKTAFIRCINLSQPELGDEVDKDLFQNETESELWDEFIQNKERVTAAAKSGDFDKYLSLIDSMSEIINTFFDTVLVMDKDVAIKENRLKILNNYSMLAFLLADFSKLS